MIALQKDKSGIISRILFISLFFCFYLTENYIFSQNKLITENWKFCRKGDTCWYNATVPGTVHTDLLAAGVIPDPFYGDNESLVQWVEKEDWVYETIFDCNSDILENQHVELVFEGIDTYADVYLNDSLLVIADNMFRTWRIDVKTYLKQKNNRLKLYFYSPLKRAECLSKSLTYILPGGERVFTRKAQYHYGWDWGPRLVTFGLWKPVYLHAWTGTRIENLSVNTIDIKDSTALMVAKFSICSDSPDTNISFYIKHSQTNEVYLEKPICLKQGENTESFYFEIPNPKLWWCNGLGQPNLYQLSVALNRGKENIVSENISVGIRKIELVREQGTQGESFFFKLNGIPVFAKGANFISPDNFLPRVDYNTYKNIITAAVRSNMNMLRVWGGGIYGSDEFYQLCDEYGILVWQDFMFACAMYPGDSAFVENVKQEVLDNIYRLRCHPSLALWCGNNEIDEGWHNWGWQQQYSYTPVDSMKIWSNYLTLFDDLIPKLIQQTDSGRVYWPSSPRIGWGHKESLEQGDCHYWGVWWGMEPFYTYKNKVGRFMSEYGFQAFPDHRLLQKYISGEELTLNSPAMKTHQKHPTGFETIDTYMQRQYLKTANLDEYIYKSQLLQAYGIKTAIEAHRRAMPYCMGTLYWQLNDCWPVISWSGVDYGGEWKAMQYFVKKAYRTVFLSFDQESDSLNLWVVNDSLSPVTESIQIKLIDFDGKEYFSDHITIFIPAQTSKNIYSLSVDGLIGILDTTKLLMYATSEVQGIENAAIHYFCEPKNLKLPQPAIDIRWVKIRGENVLNIQSKTLVKNAVFSNYGYGISDNYFDIIPGQSYFIKTIGETKISSVVVKSLNFY